MCKIWISMLFFNMCLLVTPGAHAAMVSVDASVMGSIIERSWFVNVLSGTDYTSINPRNTLEDETGLNFATRSSYRNTSVGYVVFDLSGAPRDAQTLTLEMDVAYAKNANPNLTIHALDPATVQGLMANPAGTQSASYAPDIDGPTPPPAWAELAGQYSAIRGGAELGVLSQLGPFDGTFSIDLTSTALDLVNGTDGLFALGLTWTSNISSSFGGYDRLAFEAPSLILGDSVSAVPLPAAAWLFGSALIGLVGVARRSKSNVSAPTETL